MDGVPLQWQKTDMKIFLIPFSSLRSCSWGTGKQGFSPRIAWEGVGTLEGKEAFFFHLLFPYYFKSLVPNLFEDMDQPLFQEKNH